MTADDAFSHGTFVNQSSIAFIYLSFMETMLTDSQKKMMILLIEGRIQGLAAPPLPLCRKLHVGLPGVVLGLLHVGDLADVLVVRLGSDVHVLGEVEVPVLVEGQVGLLGAADLHAVLQDLDGDVWRVEVGDAADKGVVLTILGRPAAVHLDPGRAWM